MKIITYLFLILLAFFLSLVDTSFLSFLPIYSATILLTVSVIITFALVGFQKAALIFAAFAVLFYTCFSSLPPIFLAASFLILPLLIVYLKKMAIFETGRYFIFLIYFFSFLILGLALIILAADFSPSVFLTLFSFATINTLAGLAVFFIVRTIKSKLFI